MKKYYLFVFLGLFACNVNNPNILQKFPNDPNLERIARAGNLFGNTNGITIFDGEKYSQNIDKETLWNKSLQILSKFFPISTANENSGMILTDWANISSLSKNNNLYKASLLLTGENKIDLSVFEKKQDNTVVNNQQIAEVLGKLINNLL